MDLTLNNIRKNAKLAALRDGYNQVIIQDKDGCYSFDRKHDKCCPEWYGQIIEEIEIYWYNGILKAKLVIL